MELFLIYSAVMFLVTIAVFVIVGINIFKNWNKNNKSPRLTVNATIVGKRTHISKTKRRDGDKYHAHNIYYVTFQFESGDRIELFVPENQVGLLIEGDRGQLTFQGTRFLGFQRT